jgi:crotonobetaine/carnitine-CoA ligase
LARSPYSRFGSLPELLAYRLDQSASDVAVTVHGVDHTYSDLWERSARVQGWMRRAGVKKGDRIAMLQRNSVDFLAAWIGLARVGAIAVPINTASVGDGLHYTLDHSGSLGIIADGDLLAGVDALGPLPHLRWRVATVPDAADAGPPPAGAIDFSELLDAGNGCPDPAPVDPLDTMNIVYTSGTTGPPKGVMLPYLSYVSTGGYFAHHLGLHPDDVLHTCLPLFHCNAQQTTLMSGLTLGARVVIDRSFSLSRYWGWVTRSGATVSNLLGSMLSLLSKLEPSDDERSNTLRYIVAAPVPEDLHRPMEQRLRLRIIEGYGLSETGTMACINPPGDTRPGTIGLPLEYNELRIADDDGRDVSDGIAGQILTRTSIPGTYMTGYFAEPDKTAEVMAGGWFHTGDIGLRREDGYFVFVDRLKDAIRRRGENVSSFLVEKAALAHPDVAEAAAVGVPSELSEEDVMVVAVLRPGSRLPESELADWVEGRLGRFVRPRYIEYRRSLPRTETGRVQKYMLRAERSAGVWDGEREETSP